MPTVDLESGLDSRMDSGVLEPQQEGVEGLAMYIRSNFSQDFRENLP